MGRARAWWSGVFLGPMLGTCVGLPPPPPADDTSAGGGSSSVGGTRTSTDDTADGGESSSGTSTTGLVGTTVEETGPVCEDAALGASCMDAECDCASDTCFVVGPLGGVCSECDESADCKPDPGFGCNFGNPLTGTPAVCSLTGGIAESCETADDCAEDLFCSSLIEVPGILSTATCSECEGNMGCMAGDICTPTYDIANIGGNYYCAAPGSVPNEAGCNVPGDGSECMSGNCAPASLMGVAVVAVCSPCNESSDCGAGQTCRLPEIVLNGDVHELVPGMCV